MFGDYVLAVAVGGGGGCSGSEFPESLPGSYNTPPCYDTEQ